MNQHRILLHFLDLWKGSLMPIIYSIDSSYLPFFTHPEIYLINCTCVYEMVFFACWFSDIFVVCFVSRAWPNLRLIFSKGMFNLWFWNFKYIKQENISFWFTVKDNHPNFVAKTLKEVTIIIKTFSKIRNFIKHD